MRKISDLGVLNGDMILFGGPYSNLHALEALLAEAGARQIAPGNMICTGDLVAYCAHPSEVAERVRALNIPLVAGNCEIQLAEAAPDCGCGFEEGSVCDMLSKGWYARACEQICPDLAAWMGRAPDWLRFEHGGKRYVVIHGGTDEVAKFIWSSDDDAVFEREFASVEAECGPIDVVISGHSGIGFQREIAGKHWCNAGVIGMPPNAGTPECAFACLGEDGLSLHALSYDYEAAASAMEQAGLVQGYEKALSTGIWPSQDVLPEALKRS